MSDIHSTDILNTNTKDTINYIKDIIDSILNIDTEQVISMAYQTIKYIKANKEDRLPLRFAQELENKWYQSLETGKPDYTVYDDPYYLADIIACWVVYSKKYIRDMQKQKLLPAQANIIVDVGCGLGLTTWALKSLYPDASVYGTNLRNTKQYAICEFLASKYDFQIVESIEEIGKADFIFASEYFEHIINPIDHLINIIQIATPKIMYIANSFTASAIGHFPIYLYRDQSIEAKRIGKFFAHVMRLYGYQKLETGLWNNRPACWMHNTYWMQERR